MLAWGMVLTHEVNLFVQEYQIPKYEIFTPFMGIVFCGITILALTALIIFPLEFRPYAVLCCMWGLVNLIDGGSSSGLLMYILGIIFAFRVNFFKKYIEIKIIIAILFPVSAIISQSRFGAEHILSSILNFVAIILIFVISFFLFLPDIKRCRRKMIENNNIVYLPAEHFSERDIRCLKKVQDGAKYETIAKDENIAISTLKNRMKIIYNGLDVSDKTTFMSTYAGYTILLKHTKKIPSDTIPNKKDESEK
jgi:DNA-binding CsgD family transcriptional regulator